MGRTFDRDDGRALYGLEYSCGTVLVMKIFLIIRGGHLKDVYIRESQNA